jgi:hypothetical protein
MPRTSLGYLVITLPQPLPGSDARFEFLIMFIMISISRIDLSLNIERSRNI